MNREEKQYLIEQANNPDIKDISEVSDGYHTFNSLYNQRLYLWAALVKAYKDKAWKTRKHHDGEPCFGGGWFLVGITTPEGDYTYHYEMKDWNLFDCKVIDKAPEFDGHTDKDITRVLTLQPRYASHWISVEDELPPHRNKSNHKFENDFSVNCFVSDGKDVDTGYYDYRLRKWNCEFLTNVVCWYCPQPPRKEE